MAVTGKTSTLTGPEKAAVFVLSLGQETAAEVFRHLSEAEVKTLGRAMARLNYIPPEQVASVHNEFVRKMTSADGLTVDGKEFAKNLVVKTLGKDGDTERQWELLSALEDQGRGGEHSLTSILDGVTAEVLARFLENEHPQVASLIIAHLNAKKASAVIAGLPEKLQAEVILRLAKLKAVAPQTVREVGETLREQLGELSSGDSSDQLGGAKVAADLLNLTDKGIGERILEELDGKDPDAAELIRRQMFTFEDFAQLDNRAMQLALKEVAREELLLALKTASEQLKNKIFANISSRAAEILKEDMAAMGPAKLSDVEKAQRAIIETLRQLEKDGKITIASGGSDVLV